MTPPGSHPADTYCSALYLTISSHAVPNTRRPGGGSATGSDVRQHAVWAALAENTLSRQPNACWMRSRSMAASYLTVSACLLPDWKTLKITKRKYRIYKLKTCIWIDLFVQYQRVIQINIGKADIARERPEKIILKLYFDDVSTF